MKKIAMCFLLVGFTAMGLSACNRSSSGNGTTPVQNDAESAASLPADSDPVVFDPITMTADLMQLVGTGVDPVPIQPGDSVDSVLSRIGN